MTKPVEGDARAGVASGVLAKRESCRYCRALIVFAVCRDGRWRTFDDQQVPAAPTNVWAWRRRHGMEETDLVPGHRLHFCAEYADAHGPATLGKLMWGTRSADAPW
jgi:hypothetical protein